MISNGTAVVVPGVMTTTITENPRPRPRLLLVVGPTASGKTALAVQLAKQFQTAVISADSRQCYREMPVGSAAPTLAEQEGVPHFFVGDRSVSQHLSAGSFESEALALLQTLWARHSTVVVCGGAGLFIRALVEGFDALGQEQPDRRRHWQTLWEQEGLAALQTAVRQRDPAYAARADMQNHQRLIRALEIMDTEGRPVTDLWTRSVKQRDFDCRWIGLQPDRARLYDQINQRVESMDGAGLESEAQALYPYADHKALKSPGYAEWPAYWQGQVSRGTCLDLIRQHTRNYARRQWTWFRRCEAVQWIPPPILDVDSRLDWIRSNLPQVKLP